MTSTQQDRERLRERSRDRFEQLKASVGATGGALVAFSAGVDSTLVLAVAREVLGDRAVALTAHSPSVPQAERAEARALASRLGARASATTPVGSWACRRSSTGSTPTTGSTTGRVTGPPRSAR
jgi:asparagine synthetase B (glutamine-hydrolysing)